MKERPILFSAPMVRALLDGSKTQTRRVLRIQPPAKTMSFHTYHHPDPRPHHFAFDGGSLLDFAEPCPYGAPGDRLYVRETWQHANHPQGPFQEGCPVFYRADFMDDPHGPDGEKSPEGRYRTWRPSIHMPRAASRILLEIVSVRVERLQGIREQDAIAEGAAYHEGKNHLCHSGWSHGDWHLHETARASFNKLWEQINGAGSWDANPWVWVVEFKTGDAVKEANDHHRVTPEGRALGEQMARLYEIAENRLTTAGETIPQTRLTELTERCKTCAFRASTVPNGCPQTQLDISKCAAEGIPFYCHQHQGQLCRGWVVTRAGLWDVLPSMAHLTKDTPLSPPDSQRHIVDGAEAKRERKAARLRDLAAKGAIGSMPG